MSVVVSYNILASHLVDQLLVADDYDEKNRLELVMKRIKTFLGFGNIICLQELTTSFASELRKNLPKYKYDIVEETTDKEHWIAILYPLKYKLINVYQGNPNDIVMKQYNLNGKTQKKVAKCNKGVLSIDLKFSTNVIRIHNYHAHCLFYKKDVSLLLIDGLLRHMNTLPFKNIPEILAGDFNIKPNSAEYKYLTGILSEKNYPVDDFVPQQSSLNTQKTRQLTTSCINRGGVRFKGKIDYIFLNQYCKVQWHFQDKIYHNEILPNLNHGSDHVPIICKFTV